MAYQFNPFRGMGSPRFWGESGGEGGYHPRYPVRKRTRKTVAKGRPAPAPESVPKVDGKSAAAGEKDED